MNLIDKVINEIKSIKSKKLILETNIGKIINNKKYTNGKNIEVGDFLYITFNNGKNYIFTINGLLNGGFVLETKDGENLILNKTSFKDGDIIELYKIGKGGKAVSKHTLKLVESLIFFNETKENVINFNFSDIEIEDDEEEGNEGEKNDDEEGDEYTEEDRLNDTKIELSKPKIGYNYRLYSDDNSFLTFKVKDRELNVNKITVTEVSDSGDLSRFKKIKGKDFDFNGVNGVKINKDDGTIEIKVSFDKEGSKVDDLINGIVKLEK